MLIMLTKGRYMENTFDDFKFIPVSGRKYLIKKNQLLNKQCFMGIKLNQSIK